MFGVVYLSFIHFGRYRFIVFVTNWEIVVGSGTARSSWEGCSDEPVAEEQLLALQNSFQSDLSSEYLY